MRFTPRARTKIAQGSQFWARRDTEKDLFIKKSSIELIEDARHALIDTSLRSDLVSMPKNRGDFVDLGPWAKSEALHAATFSVGEIVTKDF